MKIGIIGLGYWGKIILRNLKNLGRNNLILCDVSLTDNTEFQEYEKCNDYRQLDCDYVFITTPTTTHYQISKYFLQNNIQVFCEKPLTTSSLQAEKLYKTALDNETLLFTDWIFTFNNQIETMKEDYDSGKLGEIKSISMNRLNLGPERFDVNARWDLASHDVSIIQYLFSEMPKTTKWTDYKRKKTSKQEDSSLGLLEYQSFSAIINVSWQYRKKVRECVFEFENYFIVWDDFKKFLQYEDASNINFPIYSGNLSYPCSEYSPPLETSIKSFFDFSKEEMLEQKKLTLETLKILEV